MDIETITDLPCVARVHGLSESDDEGARDALGDKFPKLPFHKIVCIGALRAERSEAGWEVKYLGAPHLGEKSETELIQDLASRILASQPRLVSFNGGSFYMPVIRYRAMINRIAAPDLECRRYWYRYGDDALELCDALSCFSSGAKVKLHELCRPLGLPGKPNDIDGSLVSTYFKEGRISEIANYCETDVLAAIECGSYTSFSAAH